MTASAVLITGLTGVTYLLTKGQQNSRQARNLYEGTAVGLSELDLWAMRGYSGLTTGTFDGGVVYDTQGGRVGTKRIDVVDLMSGGSDGGGMYGWPAYQVSVTIEWQDWAAGNSLNRGQNRRQVYATVVSAPYDAGAN